MVLVQKWPFIQTFFLKQYKLGKYHERYSGTKKRLCRLEKQEVQKVQKIDIFPKVLTHGFSPKKAIFQPLLFYKNKKFKKWKN